MNKKSTAYMGWTCLAMVCAFFVILNFLTPMVVDDCAYANAGHTLRDIFETQRDAYLHTNGRVLAHSIAQGFAGIVGKPVFNILNAVMVCGLVCLLCAAAERKAPWKNLPLLALSVLLVWFGYPEQYTTMFMIAGSLNFVWASVVVLSFLQIFFSPSLPQKKSWPLIGLCAYAFIAGFWGEMYAVCVAPAMLLVLLVDRTRRCRAGWLLFLFFSIGAAFMVLAPGNYARMLDVNAGGATPMATRLVNTLVNLLDGKLPLLWVVILALWLIAKFGKGVSGFWRANIFWWIAILVSLLFTVVSGASYQRTFFAVYTFSFVILLKLVVALQIKDKPAMVIMVVMMVLIVFDFAHETHMMSRQKKAVEYCASAQPVNGYLPWKGTTQSWKSIGSDMLSSNSQNWRNLSFCTYYDINPVALLPRALFDAIVLKDTMAWDAAKEDYQIMRLDSDRKIEMLKLTYTDEEVYVFPKKIARLGDAMGLHLREKHYPDKTKWFGFLLKKEPEIAVELVNSIDNDVFGIVPADDGRDFLFFDRHWMRWGDLDVTDVDVVYAE